MKVEETRKELIEDLIGTIKDSINSTVSFRLEIIELREKIEKLEKYKGKKTV